MTTWTLTWRDHEWTEDDITGAHWALICSMLFKGDGESWNISPVRGPMALLATLAALIMLAEQRTLGDVLGELHAATQPDLVAALQVTG